MRYQWWLVQSRADLQESIEVTQTGKKPDKQMRERGREIGWEGGREGGRQGCVRERGRRSGEGGKEGGQGRGERKMSHFHTKLIGSQGKITSCV